MEPIAKLNSYINSAIPYAWDDSESWFEFLAKVLQKVNQLIDNNNEFFAVPIETYVGNTITEWKNDGTLQSIIERMIEPMVLEKSSLPVNVKNYGAVGDGVTDDHQAFVDALDFMELNNLVYLKIPSGVYKSNKELHINQNIVLITDGSNTTIDFTDMTVETGACLTFSGSLEPLPSLGSPINDNATTLPFVAQHNLSINDVVVLYDNTDFSFSNHIYYYRAGEFLRVKNISGNNVDLDSPTFDNYPVTVSCYKFSPLKVNINGLNVISKDDCVGVRFERLYQSTIENISVQNSKIIGVQARQCFECTIDGLSVVELATDIQTNYGLGVSNCQSLNVINSNLNTVRHGLSIGGANNEGEVPNRKIKISNCYIGGILNAASGLGADIHGNSEFIYYYDCFIENGIDVAGNNVEIKRCTIRQHGVTGNYINLYEMNGCNFKFEDLTLIQTENTTINNVTGQINDKVKYGGKIVFKNIDIIKNKGDLTGEFKFVIVNNNSNIRPDIELVNVNAKTSDIENDNSIRIDGVGIGGFNSIELLNNNLENIRVYLRQTDSKYIKVKDNKIHSNFFGAGLTIEKKLTSILNEQFISVLNNTFINNAYNGVYVSGADKNFTILDINNNTILDSHNIGTEGSSANRGNLLVTSCKLVKLKENILGDRRSTPFQARLYTISDVESLVESNNINLGSVDSVSLSVDNYNTGAKNHTNSTVSYALAQPTTGDWKRGDMVYNNSPSPSNFIGWVCTVSGAPGTWKGFGIIEA